MSKSVLVIDTPKSCIDCPIGRNMSNPLEVCVVCGATRKCVIDKEPESIPEWCPLKPLPKRKPVLSLDALSGYTEWNKNGQDRGWNNCLDNITGGNND